MFKVVVRRLVELHESVLGNDSVPAPPSLPSAVLIDDNLPIGVLGPRHRAWQKVRQRNNEEAGNKRRSE